MQPNLSDLSAAAISDYSKRSSDRPFFKRGSGSIVRVRLPVRFWLPLIVLVLGLAFFMLDWHIAGDLVTDYRAPPAEPDEALVDDRLSEKNPAFIAELVDRRPEGAWRLNASAAVLRLDTPMLRPDADAALLELRPSVADAMAHAPSGIEVLPSINVIDAKAKQFDDGLFAAVDLAFYKGLNPKLESLVTLIKALHERLPLESPAGAYLAAGLQIAGVNVKTSRPDRVASWLFRFESVAMDSKPLSFYTWSPELTQAFRFMRFFQQTLPRNEPGLISDLAVAVGSEAKLLNEYKRISAFYSQLTNPVVNLTLADVFENGGKPRDSRPIAVLPSCRSRETELFRRLFPAGLPAGADLMKAMLQAIRQGKVDLAPGPGSGWYDYQIHALETLLLPEKGAENSKLLLSKAYKKRMLEAFTALMTRRRETHARDLEGVKSAMSMEPLPLAHVKPRLRVEPCPTYYLRTARSYDFLLNFLLTTVGEDGLASLHGLKDGGQRSTCLLKELR